MTAKSTLALLFLTTLVLGLVRSDWSPTAAKRQIHLSFWNGWTGPDGRVALEMIRRFNKANPDIQVSMQRMDWATYYNKLMVAAVDGRGPELFVIHSSTLPRMHRAGFVANVTNLFEGPDAIPPGDFDPYVLEQERYGSDYVGVPLDIHPQGLYCNLDLLKKAGLRHPPTNREEFLQAVRAMRIDSDHDGHPDNWGFALTLWRNNFQTLMPQFGGRYFDKDGRADLANPGNVAALEFLSSIEKEHLVPPPENGLGWVGFRQGKVGMVFEGVYMLGDLLRLDDLKYTGAPIPQVGPRPGTMADSHVLCIRQDLDPPTRSAAERFIRFMSANSIDWAAAGQVPARKSVRNNPAFAAMPVQSAFAKQIPYMLYPPRTTVLFELSLEIDLAVEKVLRGRANATDALRTANANVQAALDRDARERRVSERGHPARSPLNQVQQVRAPLARTTTPGLPYSEEKPAHGDRRGLRLLASAGKVGGRLTQGSGPGLWYVASPGGGCSKAPKNIRRRLLALIDRSPSPPVRVRASHSPTPLAEERDGAAWDDLLIRGFDSLAGTELAVRMTYPPLGLVHSSRLVAPSILRLGVRRRMPSGDFQSGKVIRCNASALDACEQGQLGGLR